MAADTSNVPQHVAIVMDGNGRWASRRLLPRTAGHREGVKSARKIIEVCGQQGVQVLTLFAFSSENWKRPPAEVSTLMDLFLSALDSEINVLKDNGVRVQFIGDVSAFSQALCRKIQYAQEITGNNHRFHLNIAVNYGGRWDIANAVREISDLAVDRKIHTQDISEEMISSHVSLAEFPSPDLFIRTGGERRISNFLLWQIAYTELYFTDVLWPDFDEPAMMLALEDYASRQRRYGMTQDQISGIKDA